MIRTTSIYGLIDPRTNEPRYVGKANNPEERFKVHMAYDDDTHKDRWINQLVALNLEPKLVIYAQVPDDMWQECEMFMIASLRQFGYPLTNETDGGDGRVGYQHTDEYKSSLAERMKGNTYAKAGKGKIVSVETRAKMSASAKRRGISGENQRKMAESRRASEKWHSAQVVGGEKRRGRGHPHTAESKRKLSEAAKRQWRRQKGMDG